MTRPPHRADCPARWSSVAAFAGWTLAIWATRIDNIWSDDALDTAGRLSRTALAASFIVLGGFTLYRTMRERTGFTPATVTAVRLLGAWTVAVWLVRGTGILLDDHDTAFKVVHTVLAVVSIALAAAATRNLRPVQGPGARPAPASGTGSHRRP